MTSDKDVNWLVKATVIYVIALCLLSLLLSASGEKVSLYAFLACCTVCTALYSSRARRVWAVGTTLLTLAIVIWDHQEGRKFQRAVWNTMQQQIRSVTEGQSKEK
jgi:hypothetical protein